MTVNVEAFPMQALRIEAIDHQARHPQLAHVAERHRRCFGLMAHTDTCVCRFARLAVPLGEGLHRGAGARKNQRSAQV